MTRELSEHCSLPNPLLSRHSSADEADEALMDRIANGEQSALDTLFTRCAKLITSVILRIVHNEAEAEDVVMEVFHEVWKRPSRYSAEKGKARAWLVRMARCRAIDRVRKCDSYSRATDRFQVEVEHDPEAWVGRPDPNQGGEQAEMRSFFQQRLLDLPPFQKEAIELAFYQGMSQREISIQTGIPLGTIKGRIDLGLKKLSISLRAMSITNLESA